MKSDTQQAREAIERGLDNRTAITIALDSIRDVIQNDTVQDNLRGIIEPLTFDRLRTEQMRQFIAMQIEFIEKHKSLVVDQTAFELEYEKEFDGVVKETLAGIHTYYEARNISPLPTEDFVRDLFSAFSHCPLPGDCPADEMISTLESALMALGIAVDLVFDEMMPLTEEYEDRTNHWAECTRQKVMSVNNQFVSLKHPLEEECMSGDLNALQLKILNISNSRLKKLINIPNSSGDYLILLACRYGHTDIVNFLIKKGADVTVSNQRGYQVFHEVAEVDPKKDVTLLLDSLQSAQASFEAKTELEQRTPLHRAAYYGQLKVINWLLKSGVDINAQESPDVDQATALHWAVIKEHPAIVNALLESGALATIRTRMGETPLVTAFIQFHDSNPLVNKDIQIEIIHNLLNHGVGLTKHDKEYLGRFAARYNKLDMLEGCQKLIQDYFKMEFGRLAVIFPPIVRKSSSSSSKLNISIQLAQSPSFQGLMQGASEKTNVTQLSFDEKNVEDSSDLSSGSNPSSMSFAPK